MRNPAAFTCNICGALKGAANHWWIVYLGAGQEVDGRPLGNLVISPWSEGAARAPEARHACGSGCTQKFVERYLATGSLEAPKVPAGGPRKNPPQKV